MRWKLCSWWAAADFRGSCLQLLPWQVKQGQPWAQEWVEMAETDVLSFIPPSCTLLDGQRMDRRCRQLLAWPMCPCGWSPRADALWSRAHGSPLLQGCCCTRSKTHMRLGAAVAAPTPGCFPLQAAGRASHPSVVGHRPVTVPQHRWATCSAPHHFITPQALLT